MSNYVANKIICTEKILNEYFIDHYPIDKNKKLEEPYISFNKLFGVKTLNDYAEKYGEYIYYGLGFSYEKNKEGLIEIKFLTKFSYPICAIVKSIEMFKDKLTWYACEENKIYLSKFFWDEEKVQENTLYLENTEYDDWIEDNQDYIKKIEYPDDEIWHYDYKNRKDWKIWKSDDLIKRYFDQYPAKEYYNEMQRENELIIDEKHIDRNWLINYVMNMKNNEFGEEANGLIPFNIQRFNELSLAYHHDLSSSAGLWGFKDTNNNVIVEPKYLFEPQEVNGLYVLCIGSGWEESPEWTEGKLWSKEQKWGVLDKNFNMIIPFEYDEISYLEDDVDTQNDGRLMFACYKYKYEDTGLKWVTIFDKTGKVLIAEQYNDVGYYLYDNQLIIYKDRERWGYDDSKGYAGIYDFNLNKVIIEPDTYKDIDYLDYNLFIVSDDIENSYNATIINCDKEIIGEEEIWDMVFKTYDNKKYKYKGKTMEGKRFFFNISGCLITDIKEIDSDEEWMRL